MQELPLTSIIILTYNNLKYTKLCLQSLFRHTEKPYELILVDNGSTDGTQEYIQSLSLSPGTQAENRLTPIRIKKIFNPTNKGFSAGCNQGASLASGKYIVFLNNDTIPQKNWLKELIYAAEKFYKIGVVGSLLAFPDGTIQHAGAAFGPPYFTHHLYKGKKLSYLPAHTAKILQAVTGACLLIQSELFAKIGGFDERYLNGFEDLDLCFKVRKEGFRILYWPKSTLIHFESVSPNRKAKDIENLELFKNQWKDYCFFDAPLYEETDPPDRIEEKMHSIEETLSLICSLDLK
ncbi:MAG: glycosyltransferase family 2 protein [Candidatus Eremiobacteraeota bacterium]|nr:glycosyltransferase family 2 protein [Candidatus Eremiobacteraeota bacterium]MCL5055486.1 glycosyltransferase family 2 protein [Bacillota bacterium]